MGTIRDDRLPFDVEVIEYAKNSKLIPVAEEAAKAPDMLIDATGARWQLSTKSEARGVDSDRDAPLVRVNFRRKDTGEVLDARVLSLWQYRNFTSRQLEFPPEEITVDEKPYEIELRNRRVYTPYKIQLNEFNHSKYEGTDIPKDYSSLVRLTDPERHEDREAHIWMNHPLWYGHETFYQSGVMGDDKGTVLQVVRNPGWFLPYLSCVLVSLGMLIHFGLHLQRFLQKKVAN